MPAFAFDSFEDMMSHLRKAGEAADARVESPQAALVPGDHFLRETQGVYIYGEVLDPVETADEEEKEYIKRLYAEPHMQHFRFSRCYSPIVANGELGDVHVSTVALIISAAHFEAFKQANWPQDVDQIRAILGVVPAAEA